MLAPQVGQRSGLSLLSTGLLLLSRDARYHLTAAATAALLLVDAWFDVVTSAPGADQVVAMVMALSLELPMAALCAVLAARGKRAASAAPDVQPRSHQHQDHPYPAQALRERGYSLS